MVQYTPDEDTGVAFEKEDREVLISCYFKLSFFQKVQFIFYFLKYNRIPPLRYPIDIFNENIPVIMEQLNKNEHKSILNKQNYKWVVRKQFH